MKQATNGAAVPAANSKMVQPAVLTDAVVKVLNDRIGDEYTAHYYYNAASNWCKGVGYEKAAAFFAKESMNELEHAQKIQKYIVDWNALPTIPKVTTTFDFANLPEVIEGAYKLEYDLFTKYNKDSQMLFSIDIATFDFLQEFRQGQTASVAEYSDLLNALQLIDVDKRLDILHFEEMYLG
jgi:ferritin